MSEQPDVSSEPRPFTQAEPLVSTSEPVSAEQVERTRYRAQQYLRCLGTWYRDESLALVRDLLTALQEQEAGAARAREKQQADFDARIDDLVEQLEDADAELTRLREQVEGLREALTTIAALQGSYSDGSGGALSAQMARVAEAALR